LAREKGVPVHPGDHQKTKKKKKEKKLEWSLAAINLKYTKRGLSVSFLYLLLGELFWPARPVSPVFGVETCGVQAHTTPICYKHFVGINQ
jgi:hypothetical protein